MGLDLADLGPAAAWLLFGTLHSALASHSGTALLERWVGRGHRLLYNAIAVATAAAVLVYSHAVLGAPLVRWQGSWRAVQFLGVGCAVLLFVTGGRHYSLRRMLGLSQLRGRSSASVAAGGRLDSSGVLGLVRHPWYTAVLLLLWTSDLDTSTLAESVVLTGYVVVGTLLEERKLVAEFGDAYRTYQARVPMFFPFRSLASRLRGRARHGSSTKGTPPGAGA